MTEMMVYTIDDPYTTETDDGISVEIRGDQTWFHVHVADPTAFLPHDSDLNLLAMSRASTLYLPELRAMMFPAVLTNTLFSIEPERKTAVFTVSFRYDDRGEIVDYRIQNAIVKNVQKLTYEQTDLLLENKVPEGDPLYRHGEAVRTIWKYADLHMRCRYFDHGAFGMNVPVPKIFVKRDSGEVDLTMRYDYLVYSRSLVAEMMISAGRAVAMYSLEHRIPVPFRSQPSSYCPPHYLNRLRESSWKRLPSYGDLYKFAVLLSFSFEKNPNRNLQKLICQNPSLHGQGPDHSCHCEPLYSGYSCIYQGHFPNSAVHRHAHALPGER